MGSDISISDLYPEGPSPAELSQSLRLRAPVASQHRPNDNETTVENNIQGNHKHGTIVKNTSEGDDMDSELSLWDQAYDKLDSELREKYEKLLSAEMAKTGK